MAFDNNVTFCGRLTKDPELVEAGDHKICNFSLGRNRYTKDKDHPVADFPVFIAFDSRAEFLCKYFKKGNRVGIQGEIQTHKYTDKKHEDVTHYSTEILVNSISFVTTKSEQNNEDNESNTPQTNNDDFEKVDNIPEDDLPF